MYISIQHLLITQTASNNECCILPGANPKPCHSVGTRPHEVRVTRVFALLDALECKYSGYAYLMRTGSDRMTRLEYLEQNERICLKIIGLRNLRGFNNGHYFGNSTASITCTIPLLAGTDARILAPLTVYFPSLTPMVTLPSLAIGIT